MNFSLYIARRYLFSKSSNNAINIITLIAAIGVIVGAFSLFIVLSAFSGLKDFSLQFTTIFDSDLQVLPAKGKTITFTAAQKQELQNLEGLAAVSETIEERVFLHYKGRSHIGYIKGVDSLYGKVTHPDSILYFGEWFVPGEHEVVAGLGTIAKLSMGVRDYGDLLEIYVPKPGTGQINMLDPSDAFTRRNVVASGVYQVNEDLDYKYIFSDIGFARHLLSLDSNQVSTFEIKMTGKSAEAGLREAIEAIFPEKVLIKNRIQQNDALYKMLNTENLAVYLIFTLVMIIALFNVVGAIIIMILDKRRDIKTLQSMGATINDVRRVFFLQGTLMVILGGVAGIILGIAAVLIQLRYQVFYITSTLPYPVKLETGNALVVFLTITILGIVASLLAAGRVREKFLN